jgi:DNA invertase Pin-like site-specific DNA recombinase
MVSVAMESTMKRIAIYLRVSTSKQETSNQRRELEAVAKRSGWEIVKVFEDAGISGAKGRDQRPGLDALLKAVNAKEFDMVATWSVDRLGRSLTDLLSILQCLRDKGVDLFLHQQGLDTSTTAGKAMFQMLGVFAEFERGIIRERVNAGLARAREKGVTPGRPSHRSRCRETHPAAPLQRPRHLEDSPRARHRHLRRTARDRRALIGASSCRSTGGSFGVFGRLFDAVAADQFCMVAKFAAAAAGGLAPQFSAS